MILLALATVLVSAPPDLEAQRTSARVKAARASQETRVKERFAASGVAYPPAALYLRAFKASDELEVWAGDSRAPLKRIVTYKICARSGELGPKRESGDEQVPEGVYTIDRLNPFSNYHLSLGIDYPNASDRILGNRAALGGDIFIHGDCVTIGCLPIEDGPIEELYLMVLDAKLAGLARIDVHIFPSRLDEEGLRALAKRGAAAELMDFWRALAAVYSAFEQTKRVPKVRIDAKTGAYGVGDVAVAR